MPSSFQEVLNSRLFNFVVGEAADGSASRFSVHEDAIAQLSEPLRALVKAYPEAQVGTIVWKDVSKDTFERFAQFAYTGNYSIPKTAKRDIAVATKANGVHPSNVDISAGPGRVETTVNPQALSPEAPNGIIGRVDSLGSDETTFEARDTLVSGKIEEDGTILNYPIPMKKHKKKKQSKGVTERAERESKETVLKAEKEAVPEPQPKSETDRAPETQTEEAQTSAMLTKEIRPEAAATLEEEKPGEMYHLTADFSSLSYPILASLDNYEGTCEPSPIFKKGHTYYNVFTSHASLYALADIHMVDSLKALALFKLHKTLCTFELDNENISDITDLARYAYTGKGIDKDEGIGGLRSLVCQYMAIHAVELAVDHRFMNLLAGGGQIVKDFFQFQLQRIH